MGDVHESGSCSVAACAEIIGSKWTALLVHDLSEGPRRFTQLEHSCTGISPRTLSERLRWLEDAFIFLSVACDAGVAQGCKPAPHFGTIARFSIPKLDATPGPFRT